MTKAGEIRDFLFAAAPRELAMDFDNVGLLVGSPDTDVTKALFSLDITTPVIDEAAAVGAQLIVSHHPVIWDAMKSVTGENVQSAKVVKLIKCGLAAICMHTNLDIAAGGVNDVLMERLGGTTAGILESTGEDCGCGRTGELKAEMPFRDFLSVCKNALNADGLRFHDAGLAVKKLAVMGGAGGDCVELAKSLGCDTYVTADVKYDQFLTAAELGINLIDADHFCTENVIVPKLAAMVSENFPDVKVCISKVHGQTAKFYK
jgi:dinuclear metal center YbgI/SA1388 family protein